MVFTSTWEGGWSATGSSAVPAGSGGRCSPTTLLEPGWGWWVPTPSRSTAGPLMPRPLVGGRRKSPADPTNHPRRRWISLDRMLQVLTRLLLRGSAVLAALPSLRQAPPSLLAGCSINMFPTSCTLFPFPDSSLIATNRFKLTKPILNDLLSL